MIRTILKYAAVVLLLLLVVLVSLPWWFNWNWLRGPIATAVEASTGRQLEIASLDVDLGWTTSVEIREVSLANAEWATPPRMVDLNSLDASIKLLPLLRLDVVLPELMVDGLHVSLTRNAQGESNWVFSDEKSPPDKSESGPVDIPEFSNVVLRDLQFDYQDATRDFEYAAHIDELVAQGGGGKPIRVDGQGQAQGEAFELDITTGSIASLQANEPGFPIELQLLAGPSALWLNGTADSPGTASGLNIDMRIQGPNLGKWFTLTSIPLPETPPYELAGRLRHVDSSWRFENFDGRMGDSDLKGYMAVDLGGPRMAITADLESEKLDFDDLGPLIGVPPDEDETASSEQVAEAEVAEQDGRLIPDKHIPLAKLRTADAKVELRATRVLAPDLPIDDLKLNLDLSDGVMRITPFSLGFAGGRLNAYATIDASVDPVIWNFDFRAREFGLEKLLSSANLKDAGKGRLSGDLKLEGRGEDLRGAAADSSGRITLVVNGGRFSGLLMELIGLDVAESLGMLVGGSQQVDIRCLVVDLDVDEGLVESRSLVLDTSDTRVNGELEANLENEQFSLRLEPAPKDPSLFSMRTPFELDGKFSDINIAPDYGVLGLRLGAAVALGALATPAALLAFLEPGPASDAQCEKLLGAAEKETPDAQ